MWDLVYYIFVIAEKLVCFDSLPSGNYISGLTKALGRMQRSVRFEYEKIVDICMNVTDSFVTYKKCKTFTERCIVPLDSFTQINYENSDIFFFFQKQSICARFGAVGSAGALISSANFQDTNTFDTYLLYPAIYYCFICCCMDHDLLNDITLLISIYVAMKLQLKTFSFTIECLTLH